MATKLEELQWKLHCYRSKQLLHWGLKHHYIAPYGYDGALMKKLRTIYDGVAEEIDRDIKRLGIRM